MSTVAKRNRELENLTKQREKARAELATAYARLRQLTRRLEVATEEERKMIDSWGLKVVRSPFANLPRAKGPGRDWTVAEVTRVDQ